METTPGWRENHVGNNRASTPTEDSFYFDPGDEWGAGSNNLERRNTNVIQQIKDFVPRPLELHEEEGADLLFDDDERQFINLSFLSNFAVQVYDTVPRGIHVKGSIPYHRAFTGKDVVVCALCTTFPFLLLTNKGGNSQRYIPLYNGN